jgi:primosomal protein N'
MFSAPDARLTNHRITGGKKMNVTEFQGEKTVSALAKRLLAEPTTDTPKTTQVEMEAALLRLNPQLSKIRDLDKGTPIVVPDNFALDPAESAAPMGALADELLAQAEAALANLRATLKARSDEFTAQAEQVQSFLKSQQAKDLVKETPELKETFSAAATAAKATPKEQAALLTAETKAISNIAEQVKTFRTTNLRATVAGSGIGRISG